MSRVVWVHRDFFDTNLDRTTWVEMARALGHRGYGVHMVCAYRDQPVPLPGFEEITWLPPGGPGAIRRALFSLRAWLTVLRLVAAGRPDLVIVDEWTVACGFPLDLAARLGLLGTRFILDMRTVTFGDEDNEPRLRDRVLRLLTRLNLLYNRIFQQGLTVIVPSLAVLARRYGARARIGVWGSGVSTFDPGDRSDPPGSDAAPGSEELRRWRHARFRLIYHGSVGALRGLFLAVDAIAECRDRGASEPVLLVLGRGSESTDLELEVARLALQDQCILHPPIPQAEVAGVLADAQLGVMVYPDLRYWDFNHPIKLIEYLGAGVPVLCSDVPMFRNVDPTGDVLIYTSTGSAPEVADSIVACMEDPEGLAARAERGRAIAADSTWERQAGRLLAYAGLPETVPTRTGTA